MTLLERLREVRCDRQPFTPEHADCICRLTNAAADELEQMRALARECWPFLFDDSGTPIAPEDLRQRFKDLALSAT